MDKIVQVTVVEVGYSNFKERKKITKMVIISIIIITIMNLDEMI